ncbi:ABC transporter ATP-binding protein [Corynebacterium heidelbergense]|uniref:Trehalose import ATP-binding protein SugC n=1 Tax=Corynebacterium heidelbergense TaxID=2055947 RepID=A0A364V7L7_9CORY|nr:sugar ABC transporter ATP-binding protein [Corynebacterium heidelbergense]
MASVTLESATRRYDAPRRGHAATAVDSLNLTIEDGEFLVLVGPSGCGKSTTLRMVAGLEPVNEGRVLIGGKDVTGVAPKDRDIAMVFQNYALYPNMSVAENMSFALRNAGVSKSAARARVEEVAEMLQLTPYLDRKPSALSGGQRQRVAMGRAIVREPAVFCMDEPLSNLDAALRLSTRAQIADLQRRLKTTTLYVTHDQVEAMTMGDRVCVLRGGVLQQVAAPQELYRRPANAFVAGFIGTPAMNLVRRGDVIVGARPEDLHIRTDGSATPGPRDGRPFSSAFRAEIQHVEDLGSTVHVFVAPVDVQGWELINSEGAATPTQRLTVEAARHSSPQVGDVVVVEANQQALHVFDAETGNRI